MAPNVSIVSTVRGVRACLLSPTLAPTLALMLALACGIARADTPVALFQSFAGNVNFTGTQATMRTKANNQPCRVASAATDIAAVLTGIPAGATILSAQLYWSGSGSSADHAVVFDGAGVAAPIARRYKSATVGSNFDYFGGAADVTAQVAAKGNASYRFSGLEVDSGKPYCAVEGVLGGFALLVVYASAVEPFRVLNVYEGFQYIRYSGLTLNLGNFRIPDPLGNATARLGHITWEGDATLDQGGEKLLFNDVEMVDKLNKSENQFNSKSNIDDDAQSYGIDFDAYTVGSPVIKPGQTSASTRYQSGQDLVLLNAEIIAVPNVPVADLAIAMARTSELVVSGNASYTLTVTNRGPNTESGPITVTDTVPAGMRVVSASGNGWNCASAGQAVSCTWPGSLDANASPAPLTLTVAVEKAGNYTNTARVAGQLFDNVQANNSASDTAFTVGAGAGLRYAFTDGPCIDNVAFDTPGQCVRFKGPVVAGAAAPVYVTALEAGVPRRLSAGSDTTLALRFALSCHNPGKTAGVNAVFGGQALPPCSRDGTAPGSMDANWSPPLNLVFGKGNPSAPASPGFVYDDVGRVQLYLRDAEHRVVGGLPFVSKPARLAFSAIRRSADGLPNPGALTGAGPAFVKAGEAFTIEVSALAEGGTLAPNFGNEGATVSLSQARPGDAAANAAMLAMPVLDGGFTEVANGKASGAGFSWSEAGMLVLAPLIGGGDYLGAGPVAGVPANVGRFYPDHFKTVATGPFGCLPRMACPAPVDRAAWSGQPFGVAVRAFNAADQELLNYNGVLARDIMLSAVDANGAPPPGGSVTAPGTLSGNLIKAATIEPNQGARATPAYALRVPFVHTRPHALDWTGPATIFMRASSVENGAAGPLEVSSLRAANSAEGGLTIVNGRLRLSNAYGSELLKLPVKMQAQYWSAPAGGAPPAWASNSNDSASSVDPAGIVFSNCLKKLQLGPANPACKTAPVLGPVAGPALVLKDGAATFWLGAPGAGNDGSADIRMSNPAWLPSTAARAVFGIYKSELIYMREVY